MPEYKFIDEKMLRLTNDLVLMKVMDPDDKLAEVPPDDVKFQFSAFSISFHFEQRTTTAIFQYHVQTILAFDI